MSTKKMETLLFPSQYREALVKKTKNTTIRIGAEYGKYQAGRTYACKSYAGRDWGIRIKVSHVKKTSIVKLQNRGIPLRSVESIKRKEKVNDNQKVEIIQFKIL